MRLFLAILLLCLSIPVFPKAGKKTLIYDTLATSVVKKASPEKEREIFSDQDFIYQKEAKASKGWLEAFLDWIGKLFGRPVSKNPGLSFNLFKYTLLVLFIAGLIFTLWKSKFRGLLKGRAKKTGGTAFNDLPENIEGIDIDALIEEALRAANYRVTIRWCFLKALQILNKQGQITWQSAKTNIDYQNEVKDNLIK